MKIFLVRRGYSRTGGAEAYIVRLGRALSASGHEVILLGDRPWPSDAGWPGAIRVLPGGSPRAFAESVDTLRKGVSDALFFSMERLHSCDIYRAGDGVHRAWLDRRRRASWALPSALREMRPAHRELLELERHLFRPECCRGVIANSNMVRDEIVRHFAYPPEQIEVVRNGAPPPPGAELRSRWRAETRRELGIDPGRYVLLFAGTGWGRKGLACAVRAINRAALASPLLLVAGRGHPGTQPKSKRTRFLGPARNIPALMAASDAFILPTLYDPFSNASLEALSFGLPLLTTRANGVSEIIENDRHGTVVEDPADADAFASAIEFWAAPDRRRDSAGSISETAARFTIGRNLAETVAIFERLKPLTSAH